MMTTNEDRIEALIKKVTDLKQNGHAHSIPPVVMEQLDELERALHVALRNGDGSIEAIPEEPHDFKIRAIGHVINEFHEPASPDDIRSGESEIVLDPHLVDGLEGLSPGRKLMVVFYFHRSEGYDLRQHPRGDQSRPKRGVFALCSPRRPNPIGVTVVDLLSIHGNVLRVTGLDALNGTPVLDLKPV